jgi:hypothetical protein
MRRSLPVIAVLFLVAPLVADTPQTRGEIEAFMRTAKVVGHRDTSTGVTRPTRLTLSDGAFKHDAVFQPIDQRMAVFKPDRGKTEFNFVDSWKYNIAADRIGALLGLAEMMPPTIEYRYDGKTGALAWWMDSLMNEGDRLKKKVEPPNPEAWNQDMFRQRMFTDLVLDTDRNLTNVLVSPEWRVIMIDFTRAFRLAVTIRPKELTRGDRALLAKMAALTTEQVSAATKDYLTKFEIESMMKRRDLIVTHYKELAAKLGEAQVLF